MQSSPPSPCQGRTLSVCQNVLPSSCLCTLSPPKGRSPPSGVYFTLFLVFMSRDGGESSVSFISRGMPCAGGGICATLTAVDTLIVLLQSCGLFRSSGLNRNCRERGKTEETCQGFHAENRCFCNSFSPQVLRCLLRGRSPASQERLTGSPPNWRSPSWVLTRDGRHGLRCWQRSSERMPHVTRPGGG